MTEADESASEKRFPPVSRTGWLLLACIGALGAVLRGVRLAESPGGYLVFNEGFYIDLAHRMQNAGAFAWFFEPLDVNNPPLYAALVSGLYRWHVPVVVAGRIVSVGAGVGSVLVVFALGRLVFDERTGLVAAATLAVMPGVVLVNHNIQVDSLFVFLVLGATFLYVLSIRIEAGWSALAGGLVLGLGMLAKQPAVLALVALGLWDTWRTHGIRWAVSKRFVLFAAASLAVGGSWYLLQIVSPSGTLLSAMASIAARPEMSRMDWSFWTFNLASELVWMVFPLAAVAGLAGGGFLLWERKVGDKLVLVFLATFLCYYIGYHVHSYYLLPLAPFIALAIGRLAMGLVASQGRNGLRVALVAVLIAAMSLGSLLMMADKKWGVWSPLLLDAPSASSTDTWLYVSTDAQGFFGPLTGLVGDGRGQVVLGMSQYISLTASETRGVPVLVSKPPDGSAEAAFRPRAEFSDTVYRIVLFGWALEPGRRLGPPETQVFTNNNWIVRHVGAPWRFGFDSTQRPSGWRLYDTSAFSQ